MSALGRGGPLLSSHACPSVPHCDSSGFPSFLQVFAEHILCARPTDGSALRKMAFQGEKQEDLPLAKQMTLRPHGLSFALVPCKALHLILYL